MAWMKIPAFAASVGRSPQYIGRLINQGKIPDSAVKIVGKRKHVDSVKAMAALEKNISHVNKKETAAPQQQTQKQETPKKSQKRNGYDTAEQTEIIDAAGLMTATLAEAQTFKERYLAALRKVDYEERIGKLVSAEDVRKEAFETARQVRDGILNVIDRVAAVIAAETDEKMVADVLRDELTQAMEALVEN